MQLRGKFVEIEYLNHLNSDDIKNGLAPVSVQRVPANHHVHQAGTLIPPYGPI